MRYWPKEILVDPQAARQLVLVSAHERSTRTLEDNVKRQPIPRWVVAVLSRTAFLNLLWVYWLAALVF
jgi:hypothetical protein